MESCDFVNEEFPAEIQKFAKKQQVLNYAKYSNFLYTVLPHVFILSSLLAYCTNIFHLEVYLKKTEIVLSN
jgi:hypothetical protein